MDTVLYLQKLMLSASESLFHRTTTICRKYSRKKTSSATLSDRSGLKHWADRKNLKGFKKKRSPYICSVLPPNPCLGKSSVDSFSDASSSQEQTSVLVSPSPMVSAEQCNFCCLFLLVGKSLCFHYTCCLQE